MAKEEIKEEVVVEEPKEEKKGLFQKAKDAILPDADEQAAIISTFVRITVLAWSGGILTLNYVAIPGVPQQKIDPTFIASVFTGVLASFGIQTASKKGDGTMKMDKNGNAVNGNGNGGGISKKDLELLIRKHHRLVLLKQLELSKHLSRSALINHQTKHLKCRR